EQHLREPEIILRRAHEPAAAREVRAVHEGRIRLRLEAGGRPTVERGEPGSRLRRVEERVFHAERLEEALAEEAVGALPGRHLDDADEDVEARLGTVGPPRARLELE